MARKTYHHLNVGDYVVVERVVWDGQSNDLTVTEQFTRGKVIEVGVKQVKITLDWKGTTGSFSRQGGQEWGCGLDGWRIAPAHARVKGAAPKPYTPPKALPTRLREFAEYPGQPLVSAAYIVATFRSPEEAALPSIDRDGREHGWCVAEGTSEIPGAGGQATKAVAVLLAYRKHGSIDKVIETLHEGWERTCGFGTGNHEHAYEPGMEKARKLEPMLRQALAEWL